VNGVSVRTLPGARCLSLLHLGPYDQLGRSYERVLHEAKRREANLLLPTREVYVKGPGMIFKGNPKNYLTEILLPFET
jgi:effector-binding domain-containing protein